MPMANGTPKSGFWSLPRKADQILALKDPETRQRTLRQLRRARWLYLLAAGIYVIVLFLPGSHFTDEFFPWMLFLLLLFSEGERRIETILLLDLLVFPALHVDKQ